MPCYKDISQEGKYVAMGSRFCGSERDFIPMRHDGQTLLPLPLRGPRALSADAALLLGFSPFSVGLNGDDRQRFVLGHIRRPGIFYTF